jgi:hypothetical protein
MNVVPFYNTRVMLADAAAARRPWERLALLLAAEVTEATFAGESEAEIEKRVRAILRAAKRQLP